MIQLYDFPGGIHPPENKELSNPGQLVTLPLPEELIIPLGQHIGAPSEAVVKKGDQVSKGQLIAKAIGSRSADLHAPTSGLIADVSDQQVAHASGLRKLVLLCKQMAKILGMLILLRLTQNNSVMKKYANVFMQPVLLVWAVLASQVTLN